MVYPELISLPVRTKRGRVTLQHEDTITRELEDWRTRTLSQNDANTTLCDHHDATHKGTSKLSPLKSSDAHNESNTLESMIPLVNTEASIPRITTRLKLLSLLVSSGGDEQYYPRAVPVLTVDQGNPTSYPSSGWHSINQPLRDDSTSYGIPRAESGAQAVVKASAEVEGQEPADTEEDWRSSGLAFLNPKYSDYDAYIEHIGASQTSGLRDGPATEEPSKLEQKDLRSMKFIGLDENATPAKKRKFGANSLGSFSKSQDRSRRGPTAARRRRPLTRSCVTPEVDHNEESGL